MKIYSIFSMHVIIVNNSFVHVYIFKSVKIHNVYSKFTTAPSGENDRLHSDDVCFFLAWFCVRGFI